MSYKTLDVPAEIKQAQDEAIDRAKRKVGVNTGNAGKGRPKGVPNKTTALLKDAILRAAEKAGGGDDGLVTYLEARAIDTPGPFLALLGKVLPMQIAGADGEDGKPQAIQISIIDPRS